jgi:glycosyltransferase involved in cell wall biosynthesis
MAVRALVIRRPGERELVGRTLRALGVVGVDAQDAGVDPAGAIVGAGGPIWLVSAGAWPTHPGPIPNPPPSATGKPLVAFGSVCGGTEVDPSGPASLYLERDPAQALALRLQGSCEFKQAVQEVLAYDRWRLVRFGPLDVRHDPGLRIVQVVTSLQRGGAERLTLELSAELSRQGASYRVMTLGPPSRQAFATSEGVIELARLGLDRPARAEAVGQFARTFAADLIHGHLLGAAECAVIAAQGIPLVVTVHNQRPGWPSGMANLGAHDASLLVACARAVESELIEAGLPVPVRVAWNGVDPAAFRCTPARRSAGRDFRRCLRLGPDDFVILALANPRPQKRLDRLPCILAAAQAKLFERGARREPRLVIAGEASPSSPDAIRTVEGIRTEVDRLGLAEFVRWAGPIDDVAAALTSTDVLISTSDYEGLSLAQLEALAAGVPVVATEAGGVRELARGCPGVIILPRDATPDRFAEALAELAESPVPTTLPLDFTRSTMAGRYTWLYRRALSAGPPRRSRDGLLLVTNNLSLGGAQSSARRLLTGLAACGVRSRAVVLQEEPDDPTPGRRALLAAGVPVLALPPAGSIDAAQNVARLLGHVDDDPPAAVLLWNVIPEYRVLIADGLFDVPLFDVSPGVTSFDALDRYFERPRPGLPYRTAFEYGARLTGAIVKYHAESERAARTLGCPAHVIPNGVPIDAIARRPRDGRVVIGTSARINPQKRLELLLDAIGRAHRALPSYVLRIAGGIERGCDSYAAELRRRAAELPVEWLGALDDVSSFLGDLDLFVLVAEPAGCPNASLEAMAAGLPVIATDSGGMSEQVEESVTGRLVARDDADKLAAAIVEVARDPDRCASWGDAGKRRVAERFGLERMVEDYGRVCLDRTLSPLAPPRRAFLAFGIDESTIQ